LFPRGRDAHQVDGMRAAVDKASDDPVPFDNHIFDRVLAIWKGGQESAAELSEALLVPYV